MNTNIIKIAKSYINVSVKKIKISLEEYADYISLKRTRDIVAVMGGTEIYEIMSINGNFKTKLVKNIICSTYNYFIGIDGKTVIIYDEKGEIHSIVKMKDEIVVVKHIEGDKFQANNLECNINPI